jgi:hypothetical protein
MARMFALSLTLLSLTLSVRAQTAPISPASPFPAPPARSAERSTTRVVLTIGYHRSSGMTALSAR